MKLNWVRLSKEMLLLATLITFAIAANWLFIKEDLLFPEQGIFYGINSLIHSFADLVHIYTHPLMLDFVAPFFRPSGHFLMYQLLTPIVGWHSTRALLVVNLVYLGLAGYMMSKIYQSLFPKFKIGAYIAFGFYVMSPALTLSKISIMHFEFAYIFFSLLSLYLFISFCQKNINMAVPRQQPLSNYGLLLSSIFFYVVAFTFKEPSIMVGPVAVCYLLFSLYPTPFKKINKEIFYVVCLWGITAITLSTYLKMSWSNGLHPLVVLLAPGKLKVIGEFTRFIFSTTSESYIEPASIYPMMRGVRTPFINHICVWLLLFFTSISLLSVFRHKNTEFKKSILFLLLAGCLFLVIPVFWGMGLPWHTSLTLVCEGMLLGFGCEYYLRNLVGQSRANVIVVVLTIILGISCYKAAELNFEYLHVAPESYALRVSHNAVFNPPNIKAQLNPDTILVVQDRKNIGDYMLGNSTYPVLTIYQGKQFNYDHMFSWGGAKILLRPKPVYNGNLFRWAYLMPNLKEELIPFTNTNMELVDDVLLEDWLRNLDKIICITYNDQGVWFDNTAAFKKTVMQEQNKRHLAVNSYKVVTNTAFFSKPTAFKILPYADPLICQTFCDRHKGCQGFTYINYVVKRDTMAKCFFYNKVSATLKPCPLCTGYMKLTAQKKASKVHAA